VSLAILNVGEGDTKITFDPDKPDEAARARRVVSDLLKLGYAILVRVNEKAKGVKAVYRRAVAFDPQLNEYLVRDAPGDTATGLDDGPPLADEKPAPKPRRGTMRRIPASAPGVAVARSAGGMSDAADSIEAKNLLERFDSCANVRNRLRAMAEYAGEWAGLPMPLEGLDLVIEPRYPHAHIYQSDATPAEPDDEYAGCTIRNRFYSVHKRRDVVIWEHPDGTIDWGLHGTVHHFDLDMMTMTASCAWGIEQEAAAVNLLGTLVTHHQFKSYMLTGMFIEQSMRSGVFYFFRRLKPTVAASGATGDMRILTVLCQHPIAYYQGTWAGAMCPTDDVVASLMLMRGDEGMFWKRCNQHRAFKPEAGL